jgi:hypothetical protein
MTKVVKHECPCCNTKLSARWELLSKGLAETLAQFREAVISKGENKIHLQSDLRLSKNQYNNFQKLRYHGLVAKTDISGVWLLTRRGNRFLRGEIEIPKGVLVSRNKIQAMRRDKIKLLDLCSSEPYWFKKEDFTYELLDTTDYDLSANAHIIWDEKTGQGTWDFNNL